VRVTRALCEALGAGEPEWLLLRRRDELIGRLVALRSCGAEAPWPTAAIAELEEADRRLREMAELRLHKLEASLADLGRHRVAIHRYLGTSEGGQGRP